MDHSSIQIKFNESSWPHLSESFLSASGTVLSAIRIAKPGTGRLFLKEFVSGERDEMHSDIKSQSPMQVLDLETQAAEGKRALFQG